MSQRRFIPKPGQVDYTDIRYCPVVNCVISYGQEILLQRRSQDMNLYPGYWSGVSGFLDTAADIREKIYEEASEEFGIKREQITGIEIGQVIVQEAPKYGKTWIVFPAKATIIKKIEPKVNWEVAEARWIAPKHATELDLLPGFKTVLGTFSMI